MVNSYSPEWHRLFGATPDPVQTKQEVAFLTRILPLPQFRSVLDVACGFGRHARALAGQGYEVVGVERNPEIASKSRIDTRILDMRQLHQIEETFDAVICMWQSFGYFDDGTNVDVLRQMADRLRPKGRLVLDVYHRGFFEVHSGEQVLERAGRLVRQRSELRGKRLRVWLETGDILDWRLYTPDELIGEAGKVGLSQVVACSGWEELRSTSPDQARMQFVFERVR